MTGAQTNTTSVSFQPFRNDMMIEATKVVRRYMKMLNFSPIPSCILSKSLKKISNIILNSEVTVT